MTPEASAPPKKTSVWVYVGIGCGVLMLFGCLLFGAIGYFTKKQIDKLVQAADPAQVEANAKALMGGIPAGYHTLRAFGVPFIMDMALLGDQPLLADGGTPDLSRGFLYFRIIETEQCKGLKKFFETGESVSVEQLQRCGLGVSSDQVINRGTLNHEGRSVFYVSQKGSVRTTDNQNDGLQTMMFFDCPKDSKNRIAVWFQKYEGELPTADSLPAESVVDPKAIENFIKPLSPCGR